MKYVDFDPKKHEGRQLYELQDGEENGLISTVLVPSKVTFEQAKETPWYYMVLEE